MHKKNQDNLPDHTKPKKNNKAGFLVTTTIASLMGGVLLCSPAGSQVNNNNSTLQKKNTIELVEKNDTLEHQKIITMNVDKILAEYGEEKGMEIINDHFLIELNALRKSLQAPDLEVSDEVKKSSKKQANYLDSLGKFEHMSGEQVLWKRLKIENIEFYICGENLAKGEKTIKQLMEDWIASKGHYAAMTNKDFTKFGLRYKNGKWVLILIG